MTPSAADLTACLYRSKYLPVGRVKDVTVEERFEASADALLRLRLGYSDDAPSTAPKTLIYKHLGPAWYEAVALPELRFYTELEPLAKSELVPAFYGAVHVPTLETCALLVEDLGPSYTSITLPVSDERLRSVADTLAQWHAFWWNHPRLFAADLQRPASAVEVTRMAHALAAEGLAVNEAEAKQRLKSFAQQFSGELSADETRLLTSLGSRWGALFRKRLKKMRNLTLLHGDFHLLGNIFVAKQPDGPIKAIDWGQVKPGLGPHDLMYTLLSADADDRQSRDAALLQRYFRGLYTHGVTGYSWETCLWDYRFSLLTNLWQAILQGSLRWFRKTAEVLKVWDSEALLD